MSVRTVTTLPLNIGLQWSRPSKSASPKIGHNRVDAEINIRYLSNDIIISSRYYNSPGTSQIIMSNQLNPYLLMPLRASDGTTLKDSLVLFTILMPTRNSDYGTCFHYIRYKKITKSQHIFMKMITRSKSTKNTVGILSKNGCAIPRQSHDCFMCMLNGIILGIGK